MQIWNVAWSYLCSAGEIPVPQDFLGRSEGAGRIKTESFHLDLFGHHLTFYHLHVCSPLKELNYEMKSFKESNAQGRR